MSKGFLEGYYYKPRIDLDLLAQHNDGLIVLSGCMSGLVAAPMLRGDEATARQNAKTYREIFGDRFYIEVMRHGMPEQDAINEGLVRLARELDIPIVATNDSHYLEQKDASAHDVLLCIGTGKTVSDTNRMKFYSDQFYLKSAAEMYDLWSDYPEACENTARIADRVDIRIPEKIFHLPQYPVPGEADDAARSDAEYLRELCELGLRERFDEDRVANDPGLRTRLDYELEVITKMGFSSYFLIVWDFIKYARDRGIPVGPGRGSAVGSLVAYCLKITDLDPLRFNLLFERFLNPERISMPDIDTDFCVERRDEVIAYVTEKYGKDRVAQIVTFGTMAARAAVRDAGRALAVPLPDVDRIAKLIPAGPGGLTISKAIEQIPELRSIYAMQPQIRKLLDTAKEIEGLARNAGTHAAGVVISAGPLMEYTPLVRFGDGGINTQYDMNWIERIGLLKMDFLGLRNLTVMENAVREIRRTVDPQFDLAKIPLDDSKTFEMLGRGETMGVFQLESEGMKRVCAELEPSRFEDIVALVALYRPGPMDWIPQYIANKHGRTKPHYLHPKLEPILAETYGIGRLSRAGDAARAGDRRLYDERSRRTAQGHREEAKGEDPVLPREVRQPARCDVGDRSRARGENLPLRRTLRRLRLQQVARGCICVDRVSDRLLEGEPPAAVSSGADDLGKRQDRQARRVHRRSEEHRHRGAAARRQRIAGRLRRRRRIDTFWSSRDQGRRRGGGAGDHRGARIATAGSAISLTWPRASTRSTSTVASWRR